MRWALAPVHAAALATGAKSFRDNPVIGSPTLNRLGLHAARSRLAAEMADRRRRRLAVLVDAADAAAFARDGFVIKTDFLPSELFSSLQEQLAGLRAPARDMLQGDAITRRIPLDGAALAAAPAALGLLSDPRWLALIGYVASVRTRPATYIQTIFSRVRGDAVDPQTVLHADTFHATVKAWLFLQDVPEDDGPLVYAPGSHRRTEARLEWERRRSIVAAEADFLTSRGSFRVSPAELQDMGYAPARPLAVPANTLIVADTSGFHARGRSARPSARTEVWAYARPNPFLPWAGSTPAAASKLAELRIGAAWAASDARERLGLGRNPWRAAGTLGPRSPPDLSLWPALSR